MDKKWVVLCSTAIAAVYAAGYWTTENQAMGDTLQQQQQAVPLPAKNPPAPAVVDRMQVTAAPAGTIGAEGAAGKTEPSLPPPSSIESSPSGNAGTESAKPATAPLAAKQAASERAPQPKVATSAQAATSSQQPKAAESAAPAATAPAAAAPAPAASVASEQPKPAPTAPATAQAPAAAPAAPKSATVAAPQANKKYKDGTYTGAGRNRRGSIEVAVTIKNDKITDVEISRFAMHYSERDVKDMPAEVVQKQSAQVANVSGATYSTQAFKDAVQSALAQASNA